jgi:phospholipid/cholesterol/gamma-HCH transport system permease protein
MNSNVSLNPSKSNSEPLDSEYSPQSLLKKLGHTIIQGIKDTGDYGVLCLQMFKYLVKPPFYFRLTLDQFVRLGLNSFLLVLVTGLAIGSVMTLQFGYGLARFGGKLYVPKIVVLSILREMGPIFTSLLCAGRIGSGIAAEVSTLKISQQIDAIRALGTNPIKRIVIPRVMATMLALPLLTLFANWIGCVAALIVSYTELQITPGFFMAKIFETLRFYDLWTGMAKSIVFAFFIAVTACWKGLKTEGGTEGVGSTTTWVVVASSIMIMVSDFFLTKFFILTVYPKF